MYYIYHIPGVKIGCTVDPKRRVKAQKFREFEILEEHLNKDVACMREQELQKEYGYAIDRNSYTFTTNLLNYHTEETNRKKSESKKGVKRPQSSKGISEALKGRKKSPEWIAKIAATLSNKYKNTLNPHPNKGRGQTYIELTNNFIGKLPDMEQKFGVKSGFIQSSIRYERPLQKGKFKGLHFKIYEE